MDGTEYYFVKWVGTPRLVEDFFVVQSNGKAVQLVEG